MTIRSNQAIVIFLCVLFIFLVYLLSPILTPFLLSALIAYLLEPLVRRLNKFGLSHILSVILVFTGALLGVVLLLLMLVPVIKIQVETLSEFIPEMFAWIQREFIPRLQEFVDTDTLKGSLGTALPKAAALLNTVIHSGYAFIVWSVNIVLIPVVTFYFLRDWDGLCLHAKKAIPKSIRPNIVKLMHEFDIVLSSFFRGQFLVMLALSAIYGIGLTVAGLKVGLMIGIIGGLLSIVPYLGSAFVLLSSTLVTLVQYGYSPTLFYVWGVFLVGQTLEGYVLTPYLVGNRIGLHPVAVIFSIMAGGALFGFFGVLVALPAAALIKVLFQFIDRKYELC